MDLPVTDLLWLKNGEFPTAEEDGENFPIFPEEVKGVSNRCLRQLLMNDWFLDSWLGYAGLDLRGESYSLDGNNVQTRVFDPVSVMITFFGKVAQDIAIEVVGKGIILNPKRDVWSQVLDPVYIPVSDFEVIDVPTLSGDTNDGVVNLRRGDSLRFYVWCQDGVPMEVPSVAVSVLFEDGTVQSYGLTNYTPVPSGDDMHRFADFTIPNPPVSGLFVEGVKQNTASSLSIGAGLVLSTSDLDDVTGQMEVTLTPDLPKVYDTTGIVEFTPRQTYRYRIQCDARVRDAFAVQGIFGVNWDSGKGVFPDGYQLEGEWTSVSLAANQVANVTAGMEVNLVAGTTYQFRFGGSAVVLESAVWRFEPVYIGE